MGGRGAVSIENSYWRSWKHNYRNDDWDWEEYNCYRNCPSSCFPCKVAFCSPDSMKHDVSHNGLSSPKWMIFLLNFRTAIDPPPLFWKIILQISGFLRKNLWKFGPFKPQNHSFLQECHQLILRRWRVLKICSSSNLWYVLLGSSC